MQERAAPAHISRESGDGDFYLPRPSPSLHIWRVVNMPSVADESLHILPIALGGLHCFGMLVAAFRKRVASKSSYQHGEEISRDLPAVPAI